MREATRPARLRHYVGGVKRRQAVVADPVTVGSLLQQYLCGGALAAMTRTPQRVREILGGIAHLE